jgi:predicted enzyme related to lactoylglutathione lyase
MTTEQTHGARLKTAVPQFQVADVVRTAEYYRDVLGFRISSYWDGHRASHATTPPPVFGIVSRDDVQVFFNRVTSSEHQKSYDDGGYHAFFSVSDVDELAVELRNRGADIIDGPEDRPYYQRELVVRDCNGLVLAFGEDTSGRPAGSTTQGGIIE